MPTSRSTPSATELGAVLDRLAQWQIDGTPLQLHPGDVGWYQRFGRDRTAAALRTWSRGGEIVAIGMFEEAELLRLAIDPSLQQDDELAHVLLQDLEARGSGTLFSRAEAQNGSPALELPTGVLLSDLLAGSDWAADEAWTPLHLDLTEPATTPGLRVEIVGPDLAPARVAVQRDAFDGSTFSREHWDAMASGPAYPQARCLVAFDSAGAAVATTTVWSAGVGRIGVIEPLGVGREHRGAGFGTAITRAAAVMLQELGASAVRVCTTSSNVAAVAAYRSAGFTDLPQRRDWSRAR